VIKPFLQSDAFLADVAAARSDTSRPHLWWLGQSGYLVQFRGKHLLIDPYLSNSLTKKYANTDKPHVRMSEVVVAPARLDFIDVVSSSHNHTDHLDAETLGPLRRANPHLKIVVPEANRAFAADRLKVDPTSLIGMDDDASRVVDGFIFHGVPAAHEQVERDERGHLKYMGYVITMGTRSEDAAAQEKARTRSEDAAAEMAMPFLSRGVRPARPAPTRSEDAAAQTTAPWTIYHSGDTLLYDGMADRLRPFAVDLALLPINGRAPQRRTAGNLWGREAAQLARDIGAKLVVPCHYDLFEFNTATPDEFIAACERLGQRHRVPRQGERLDL